MTIVDLAHLNETYPHLQLWAMDACHLTHIHMALSARATRKSDASSPLSPLELPFGCTPHFQTQNKVSWLESDEISIESHLIPILKK